MYTWVTPSQLTLGCESSADCVFCDQVATLEAAITFLQQLLPGRSMSQGGPCHPDLLRTLSMERTRSGKFALS